MVAGESGFSILQFSFVSFFSVLMSNRLTEPNFTDMIRLAEAMAYAEPEVDQDLIEELDWIYKHTDDEIQIPLAQLEMLVFFQLHRGDTGLNKEIDINDKHYKIIELYRHLDNVNQKLVKIVVGLAKKYHLEIPVQMTQTGSLKM